ncbi:MAG: hypothetical protein ACLSVD_05630 [Eggerthellaceae bacterium]
MVALVICTHAISCPSRSTTPTTALGAGRGPSHLGRRAVVEYGGGPRGLRGGLHRHGGGAGSASVLRPAHQRPANNDRCPAALCVLGALPALGGGGGAPRASRAISRRGVAAARRSLREPCDVRHRSRLNLQPALRVVVSAKRRYKLPLCLFALCVRRARVRHLGC